MADNYLEKRMEDYRNGRLSSASHKRLTPSGAPHGLATFPLPVNRLLIAVADTALREALVRKFAAIGCKTAFVATDRPAATTLAQRSGALFIPVADLTPGTLTHAAAIVTQRWGALDLLLTDIPTLLLTDIITLLPSGTPAILITTVAPEAPHPTAATVIAASSETDPAKIADTALFAAASQPFVSLVSLRETP